MKKLLFSLLAIFAFNLQIIHAEQLIIEPDMGRAPVLNAINDSRYSIDLVMYGFTDEQFLNALVQQKLNGRTLKIILEQRPYKASDENKKTITAFTNNQIDWQGTIPPFQLIHQKTLIIDGKKALVMTFNFTNSSFKNERNFALVIDDAKLVNEIESVFDADWNHTSHLSHSDDLIWSPDDSRQKFTALINHAKKSIKMYAQSVNDYKIVGALAKAARRGVKVEILTSAKPRDKQADFLNNAGVTVIISKKLYIHAKVMIIDNEKAVIGSVNMTNTSLDKNRELAVITYNPEVIQQLNATFDHDKGNLSSAYLPDKRTLLRTIKLINKYSKYLLNG